MKFSKLSFYSNPVQEVITKISLNFRKILFKNYLQNLGPGYYQYNLQRYSGPHRKICYAAEKSMYFNINGNLTACCRNRSYILGKYPENTVREFWESEKRKELRRTLKANDFSKGCFQCKNSVENGNFDSVQALVYDNIPTDKKHPTMLEFALSSKCNLNCIMCSDECSTSFLSEQGSSLEKGVYEDSFVNQLEEFIPHLDQVRFFGGEPFLIPIYYKIWERIVAINPDCKINVQTNATILNDRIKELLKKGNFIIGVSIDSFNKNTYETIRRNANFEKVMHNVEYFAEYAKLKNIHLGVAVCPMKQNWEELPEIVLKCDKLDANVYFNPVWHPTKCSLFFLSSSELQQIYKKLYEIKLPDMLDIEKKNKYHFDCFLFQLTKWQQEKLEEETIWKQLKIDKNEWPNIVLQDIQIVLIHKIKMYLTEKKNANEHEISIQINKIISVLKRFNDGPLLRETLLRLIEIPPEAFSYDILNDRDPDSLEEFINIFSDLIKRNLM